MRPCRIPTEVASVRSQFMWDLWWTKWHWGRFSPSTPVSPANYHSTDCSIFIDHHIIDDVCSLDSENVVEYKIEGNLN
jgi:hypothetical protein